MSAINLLCNAMWIDLEWGFHFFSLYVTYWFYRTQPGFVYEMQDIYSFGWATVPHDAFCLAVLKYFGDDLIERSVYVI